MKTGYPGMHDFMAVNVAQWTIDVVDVDLMARFWSAALGYRAEAGRDGSAKLLPPNGSDSPPVWLQASATLKLGKNRIHLDVVADGPWQKEVERLIELGARPADVGQTGDEGFVVLSDPEGNEFCVLHHAPQRSM